MLLGIAGQPALAKDKYPDVSDEGLPRIESKRLDAVYWEPGASLAEYSKIMIDDVSVAFRKNWQRDQNRNRSTSRIDSKDMDRVRNSLADLFREVFVRELQEKGDYEVVESAAADVLLLRPEIIDLDIYAPDLRDPGRGRSYTTEAGRMTLRMDLVDSSTQALIGRVIDRQRARNNMSMQVTNSVTNRAEADRMLRRWADILRDALDEARAGNGAL